MLRKIKIAETAKIGNINSETAAPSGMSLPKIAKEKAQVANTCV